jgi:hypothetical protein
VNAIFWLVVAIAAASSLLLALVLRGVLLGYPPARIAGRVLNRKEQAIAAACADALFPPGGPIPLSGTDAGLVAYMDAYYLRLPFGARSLCRLLLHFIEHSPWVFGPRFARFTRLRPEERIAALRDMQTSSIYFRRVAFLSMRAMLTMGYLANGEVARRMGMVADLAPFERPSRRRTPAIAHEAFA